MIFGTSLPEDDVAREGLLDRVTVPWNIALGQTAQDAWVHNPMVEGVDALSTWWAQNPDLRSSFMTGLSDDPSRQPLPDSVYAAGAADNLVDPKSLNAKYGQSLGLSFDRPMRRGAVDIMVRRKQEENSRNAYLNRAPDGLAYGIANFATQLAVSAADPINIASAFVPIVGEARAGLWAARYGKTAARLMQGAAEGAVGAALVEPIVYGSEKYLQGDYDLMDSFLNVTVGTVLGGGLHAGFGALSDRLARLHGETREGALRAGVGQMAEGRDVDVGHVIAADPAYREASYLPIVNEREFQLLGEHAQTTEKLAGLEAQLKALGPDNPGAVDALARLQSVEQQLKSPDLSPEARRELATRRDEILTDTTPEKLQELAAPTEQRRQLGNQAEALKTRAGEIKMARERIAADRSLTPPVLGPTAAKAVRELRAAISPEKAPVDLPALKDRATQAQTQVRAEADAVSRQSLDRARTQTEAHARGDIASSAASPEAAEHARQTVKEGIGDDLEEMLAETAAQIDALEKQGALSPEKAEQAMAAMEGVALAKKHGKAAEAAARCLLLHP